MRRTPLPSRRATAVTISALACLAGSGVAFSACRDDNQSGDTARFCAEVEENLDALRATPQTSEEVDALIDLWQDVGEVAPLSIEPDWDAHILLFETTLEGEDMEEIYARIYATERSSVAVSTWVTERCGFDWGPVTTIVPQTTTTLSPPPTTS